MKLEKLMKERNADLINAWFTSLIETYPANTSAFLKNQKDPFANPVGNAFRQGFKVIIDQIVEGIDHQSAVSALDPIVRIRAVQGFLPSQAVSFVFSIKKIIRQIFSKEIRENHLEDELTTIEMRIDELSLIAFNIYMECREKVFQLKANEVRDRTFKALRRAGLVCDLEQVESDLTEHN
ncbi:MAG: hypothetical protein A2V65_11420 [Deltaproteobacteria bacterium RBG_13_49_15]|nr:MAG: hypothetical protein A2V65_11420 [Deltaproteobacteria bacterium RBG_13_49_15]